MLDSATKFEDYVELAIRDGAKAIASTEHGKPSGWISKKLYCDSVGIQFIHGVEIYLTESLNGEKVRDNYHTILLARNLDGVKELNALVSKSCDADHFYYNNRISFDEFLNISNNIISTSACLASPLNRLPETHQRYMELAQKYDFFEIQPHLHPAQIQYNQRLYELSLALNKPLIAGTDTHNSSKYKAECRAVLLSAKGQSYGDEDSFDLTYKTYDELANMFEKQNALPEDVYTKAIENTNKLPELIENFELDKSIKYPILYGSRESDADKFVEVVESKFNEKLKLGIIPESQKDAFREAIDEELRVFRKLNMDGFMLSMSELVGWCKSQGMAIGTARGSVAGSRVAYVTDIIDLNPETWHTVFSRFCNEDREEIGDIDIDVVDSDRPAIFQHITERFGRDKVAKVAAYGTLKSRAVIDEVGRHLAKVWKLEHETDAGNPYSLSRIADIKDEFDADEEKTKEKYPEIFYYYDGLLDVKVSQSVHPAGVIISPVSLSEYYGVFSKDGEDCLMMDMDEAHDVGAAKYDFLALKTVRVIRDTCRNIGISLPKSHEMDWYDMNVWNDMLRSPDTLFQFESKFAFDGLKKYQPKNIFDLCLVTAALRPSAASYRDDLFAKKPHKNPSEIIDNLLADNNGYLVYQEDVIKFLQQICGFSGSEADNIRRAIARKDRERLDKATPKILEGYCAKSDKPKEEAIKEAKTFLQILIDSASYMFGYNHSVAYCLLSYMCAYFRHYYPIEYFTAFLNNAANKDDIANGTRVCNLYGISVSLPKYALSGSDYTLNKECNKIAKGAGSIKDISKSAANEIYELSQRNKYLYFVDLLRDIVTQTSADAGQIKVLISVDYFSEFGNQRELYRIYDMFIKFKRGNVKQISKADIANTPLDNIVKSCSSEKSCNDKYKKYELVDAILMLRKCEDMIKSANLPELDDIVKIENFKDAMGYDGYISGNESDRPKLYVKAIYPLKRKKDNVQFGYSILTRSIGSGIESRFTVFNTLFKKAPIHKDDILLCTSYVREGQYFKMTGYKHLYTKQSDGTDNAASA